MHMRSPRSLETKALWCLVAALGLAILAAFIPAGKQQAQAAEAPVAADFADAREIYLGLCVTCHGRRLEGGEGPRLTDAEWLHGGTREDIIRALAKGFPQEGMPGVETIYTPEQIGNLADYILSEQLGWRSLSYEIRPIPPEAGKNFDFSTLVAITPHKTGEVRELLADFSLPEIPDYAITYSGDVMVPPGEAKVIHFVGGREQRQVRINGKIVEQREADQGVYFPLPAGRHKLEITYVTADTPKWRRGKDIPVFISNGTVETRFAALSVQARNELERQVVDYLVEDGVRLIRRRVADLPSRSIAVGYPNQVSYAFNTETCSIVGAWRGQFLNIGPNVLGRGQLGSQPLGTWIFNAPQAIRFAEEGADCRFVSLSQPEPGGAPEFRFVLEGAEHVLTSEAQGGDIVLSLSGNTGVTPGLPTVSGQDGGEVAIQDTDSDALRIVIR